MNEKVFITKPTALLLFAFWLLILGDVRGAEAAQSLERDASVLAGLTKTWKSGYLDLRYNNGSTDRRRLVMVFAPADKDASNAPDAKVELLIESPRQGIPGVAEVSTSFGQSGSREVRLRETNGVRTITIREAREKVGGVVSKEKLERILNRSAVSFTYQLKDDLLTLNGFPKGVTKWGELEFTVPETNVMFKVFR